MTEATKKGGVKRWGVTVRTLENWAAKGGEVGEEPPVMAGDPRELLEWYRRHYGREPGRKVRDAAGRMLEERGQEEVVAVEIDEAPVAVIRSALERVGLSLSLARLVEEEERCWEEMLVHRKTGSQAAAADARRRWKEVAELKRAVQKNEDAVQLALELLKAWVRTEWTERQQKLRDALVALVGEEEVLRVLKRE